MHHASPGDCGIALLESVIALAILSLLGLGMVQLSLLFRAQLRLDQACFQGARKAIVQVNVPDRQFTLEEIIRKRILEVLPENADFELQLGVAEEQISIGASIPIELLWKVPLVIDYAKYILPDEVVHLKSNCSLSSETGNYVELD